MAAAALAFTGPAKTDEDLAAALDDGVGSVVIESLHEAAALNALAAARGMRARVLMRIAPRLTERGLAGRPTQFGIDEEELPEALAALRAMSALHLDGFHIYSGSQCLDDAALAEHFRALWTCFQGALALWGAPVSELAFGAGMGISYHDGDSSLDLGALSETVAVIRAGVAAHPLLENPALPLELGRYLVGEAGLYVVRMVQVKETRGALIAICDGGMNHSLGACGHLGGVAHRHYRVARLSSGSQGGGGGTRTYRPLCTTIDTLARRVVVPELTPGDLLGFSCGGAYGPSSSPVFFISPRAPREIAFPDNSPKAPQDVSWLPGVGDLSR